MLKKIIYISLMAVSGFTSVSSYASVAHLVLNGTPGEWISGGQNVDNIYSSTDPLLIWNSATFNNIGTSTSPAADSVQFMFLLAPWIATDDQFTILDFSSLKGLGMPINTGVTYSNAERDAFASVGSPGLDISYGHHGCNTLTGDFTVGELTFDDNMIDKFSVSFNQSCDGGPLMSGSFTYDANATTLSSPVPIPATFSLFGLGLMGLGFSRRYKYYN